MPWHQLFKNKVKRQRGKIPGKETSFENCFKAVIVFRWLTINREGGKEEIRAHCGSIKWMSFQLNRLLSASQSRLMFLFAWSFPLLSVRTAHSGVSQDYRFFRSNRNPGSAQRSPTHAVTLCTGWVTSTLPLWCVLEAVVPDLQRCSQSVASGDQQHRVRAWL